MQKATINVIIDKDIKDKAMHIIQNKMKTSMTKFIENNLKDLIKNDKTVLHN